MGGPCHISLLAYYRRVSRGGPRGLGPPPLEIEKEKKKVIKANIKLFRLYFATFLVKNVIFSANFRAAPPPWKIEMKSKKKGFQILGPPPLANSWTRACTMLIVVGGIPLRSISCFGNCAENFKLSLGRPIILKFQGTRYSSWTMGARRKFSRGNKPKKGPPYGEKRSKKAHPLHWGKGSKKAPKIYRLNSVIAI